MSFLIGSARTTIASLKNGEIGTPGPAGEDGKTSYVHIAYSNSEDGSLDFSTSDSSNRAYIGMYTDFTELDSTDHTKYTWQKTKGEQGESGKDGVAGKDGVGLKNTEVSYAKSTNGQTPPTTGWTEQVPVVPGGQFLWTKTTWTYTDNSSESGYSVAKMGQDGNKGDDGIAGKDGVGISKTVIEYAPGNDGVTKPTTGWTTAIPTVAAGKYLWTRTTWSYTDGTSEIGYIVAKQGEKGDKGDKGDTGNDGIAGKDGIGLKSTTITYASSTSGTIAPTTGWQIQVPTVAPNNFLWTRTVWTYSDNTSETGYSVAKMGKDGAKGDDGIAGKDGVGINDTLIEYAISTSGTTKPTSGWSTSIPMVPQGQYLWTRTTWAYTDNTTEQGFTVARQGEKGDKGDQGIAGPKGADGKTQYTHIAYADDANGGGFSQSPTGKAYIGMYVDFEELDSSDPKKYAWSLIKGAKGDQGVAGQKGEDGRTPYFHTAYADSEDGSLDFSTTDSTNRKYMGTYTDYEQDDSTDPTKYTWSLIKGADGISSFLHTAWANVNEFPFYVKGARPNLAVKWENSSLNSNNGASYPQNSWFENDPEDGHTVIAAQRYNPELNPKIISMYNSLGITYNSSDPHAGWLTEPIVGKRVIVSYKAKVNRPSVKFSLMSTVTRIGESDKTLPNNDKIVTLTNEWQVISDVIDVVPNNAGVLRMCPKQVSEANDVMDLVVYVKDYKIEFADDEDDSQATPWLPPIIRPLFDGKELDASKGQTVGFDKYGDSTPKNEFNIKVPEWGATNAVRTTVEANDGTGLMVGQMTLVDAPKTNGTDYYDGYIYVKNDSPQPVRLKPWGGVLNPTIPPNTIARIGSAAFRTASGGYIKWELHRVDATLAVDVTWWKPRIRRYSIDHSFTESQPPSERVYLGTYTDNNPKASGDPADYEWNLVKGSDGNDGVPAKVLTLQADSLVMKFDANDVVVAGQVITFMAVKQNFESNISWVATPYKGNTAQPAISLKGTGDIRTLESSMWASGVTTIRVNISADSFTDSVIITKVKDGEKGDKGSDGIAGKDGVGLSSTVITYAASTSGTTAPSSGWTTQVPTVAPNNFLWTKTVWNYTDSTSETGYSVAKMGADGAKGDDGIAGKDGVGIKSTVIDYVVSTQGTTAPTSGWSTTIPTTPEGQFLWTRTRWTYTDNTSETGYSVAKQGAKGATGATGKDGIAGKDGVGLKSTSITYAGSTSGTTPPATGWNTQVPTVPAGQFLWTKTVWTYTDASSETGYSVAKMGQDGAKGNDGIAGKDGVGIKTTLIEYATNTSGTVRPTSGWSTAIPSTPAGQYLWTRTTWTYTDNTTEQGFTVARQGANGQNGTNGTNGSNGKPAFFHTAWANSPDGTLNFSKTDSLNKSYIGTYSDDIQEGSNDPSKYKWTELVGALVIDSTNYALESRYNWRPRQVSAVESYYNILLDKPIPKGTKIQVGTDYSWVSGNKPTVDGIRMIAITSGGSHAGVELNLTTAPDSGTITMSGTLTAEMSTIRLYNGSSGKGQNNIYQFENIVVNIGDKLCGWQPNYKDTPQRNNLLTNSTGQLGDGNWIIPVNTWEILSPEKDKPTSNIFHSKGSTTANDLIYQNPHPIQVKAGQIIVVSFDYKENASCGEMFSIRTFSGANKGPGEFLENWNIPRSLFEKNIQDEWIRVTYRVLVKKDGYLDLILANRSTNASAQNWFREIMVTTNGSLQGDYSWYQPDYTSSAVNEANQTIPRVYVQSLAPQNVKNGDQWWKMNNNKITSYYVYGGGKWNEQTIDQSVLNIVTLNAVNINGSVVAGSTFVNEFNVQDSSFSRMKGSTKIQDGFILQDVENINTNEEGVETSKAAESHLRLSYGQFSSQTTAYDETGAVISTSSANLSGGNLNLTLKDGTGNFNGTLNAKALTNTPWKSLTLDSSMYTVAENNPPMYRIIYNLDGSRTVKFKGQFKLKSGYMRAGTEYYPFRKNNDGNGTLLPAEVRPNQTEFAYAAAGVNPGKAANNGGRIGMTTTPNMVFSPGEGDIVYFGISSLSYDIV